MIILHSKKVVLFRVPKTGSTSMQDSVLNSNMYNPVKDNLTPYIKDSGIQSLHTTPQMAYDSGLLTDEMINDYKMYAVVRKPDERAMSAISHYYRPRKVVPDRVKTEIKNNGFEFLGDVFSRPQMDWFKVNGKCVVTPIIYEKYTEELCKIFGDASCSYNETNRNVSRPRPSLDEIFGDVYINNLNRTKYRDDWKLYALSKANSFEKRTQAIKKL